MFKWTDSVCMNSQKATVFSAAFNIFAVVLKKDENYGIIRYQNSGGNYAYLHIHIKREIWFG